MFLKVHVCPCQSMFNIPYQHETNRLTLKKKVNRKRLYVKNWFYKNALRRI